MQAVTRTTESPERTTTAPFACLAILPVSRVIFGPPGRLQLYDIYIIPMRLRMYVLIAGRVARISPATEPRSGLSEDLELERRKDRSPERRYAIFDST